MKRKSLWFFVSIFVCITLMAGAIFTSVQASPKGPGDDNSSLPGQDEPGARDSKKDPALKPTEKAIHRATEQADEDDLLGREKGDKKKSDRVNIRGEIISVDTAGIVIQPKLSDPVTFIWDETPIIKIPTLAGAATTTDLKAGMNVIVQGFKTETGLVAMKVLVVPGKPIKIHHVGTVTIYAAGTSITIENKKGETTTFVITAETKIIPEAEAASLAVGSVVTIIAPRDVTGGDLTAKAIVIHVPEPDEKEDVTPEP